MKVIFPKSNFRRFCLKSEETNFQNEHTRGIFQITPFVLDAPFLYPVKTSENLTVFIFQGVEKGCIGNKWVERKSYNRAHLYQTFSNMIK